MAYITTHHTYPELLFSGGRLARTEWDSDTAARAIGATLRGEPDAVVLLVTVDGKAVARGLKPAGLGPRV
jgi:hypothetical protein